MLFEHWIRIRKRLAFVSQRPRLEGVVMEAAVFIVLGICCVMLIILILALYELRDIFNKTVQIYSLLTSESAVVLNTSINVRRLSKLIADSQKDGDQR